MHFTLDQIVVLFLGHPVYGTTLQIVLNTECHKLVGNCVPNTQTTLKLAVIGVVFQEIFEQIFNE